MLLGHKTARLTKSVKSKSCIDMPKRKKSKKRAIPIPPMIMVTLTSEGQKDKAIKNIKDNNMVGFNIEELDQQGSIPIVRATHHPVQRDPGG
jgi:hypothetical protein